MSTDFNGFTLVTSLLSTDSFLGTRSGGGINFTLATLAAAAAKLAGDGTVSLPGFAFASDPNTGIYLPAADTIGFAVGGALAFKINSSAHLVSGATSSSFVLSAGTAFNTGGAGVVFRGTSAGFNDGGLEFYTGAGGTGTERVRVTSGGTLCVGNAGTNVGYGGGAGLSVDAGGTLHNGVSGALANGYWQRTETTKAFHEFFYGALSSTPTIVGSITTNGTATAYNTSSDYRLKEDLRPVEDPIGTIMKLRPVNFAWKANGARADGFLAHEFGEVIPGAATGAKDAMREETVIVTPERPSRLKNPDGTPIMTPAVTETRMVPDYQGIDQAKAVPLLVAAVQALVGEVTDLKAQLAAIKAA